MKITITLTPEQVQLFTAPSLTAGQYTGRQHTAVDLIQAAIEKAQSK